MGLNRIPTVYVDELKKDNTLALLHEHDGRDLDIQYAKKVFEHIQVLWGDNVTLTTNIEGEIWEF